MDVHDDKRREGIDGRETEAESPFPEAYLEHDEPSDLSVPMDWPASGLPGARAEDTSSARATISDLHVTLRIQRRKTARRG